MPLESSCLSLFVFIYVYMSPSKTWSIQLPPAIWLMLRSWIKWGLNALCVSYGLLSAEKLWATNEKEHLCVAHVSGEEARTIRIFVGWLEKRLFASLQGPLNQSCTMLRKSKAHNKNTVCPVAHCSTSRRFAPNAPALGSNVRRLHKDVFEQQSKGMETFEWLYDAVLYIFICEDSCFMFAEQRSQLTLTSWSKVGWESHGQERRWRKGQAKTLNVPLKWLSVGLIKYSW